MYIIAHNGAPEFGGAEIATSLLLAGLRRRGHRVLLCCNKELVAERAARHGVPTKLLPLGGDAMLPHALRFAQFLRSEAPDAVLLGTFRELWLGGLGARLAGVPWTVASVMLSTDIPRNLKYRVTLRHCVDAVVLNAGSMRPSFLAGDPRLDPRRVVTIYTGVATPQRRSASGTVRRALNLPPDAQVIGAVARLAWQKRFDRLLHALATLPEHVHCVLAGDGEQRRALEALAEELGVRLRLHLLGWRTDVGDVLDALDVFIISSDREGMSGAMLEAMAAGVPVVSTPVSGADEALAPFRDGIAPGEIVGFDASQLAGAVSRLLAEPGRRGTMSEAGKRRVREQFGFEPMVDRWEKVLAGDLTAVQSENSSPPLGAKWGGPRDGRHAPA